jgi:hypothetical protein
MALFSRRRRTGGSVEAGIERFWSWWAGARDDVGDALDDRDGGRLRDLLEPRVEGVHRDLTWFAGPGPHARFMLVLSGARNPALRVVAERWRRAGPPDDQIWEHHPAFPAEPGAFEGSVTIGDRRLEAGQAVSQVQVDDRRYRMDVQVYHPAYPELSDLDRSRIANVLVGWSLGEDDVDRWVGQISATAVRPLDSVPVAMLGAVVRQFGERWGNERWATLEGSYGNRRLIAAARHPLHRVDHPLFDEHIAVRLRYSDALPDGLPSERAMLELAGIERSVVGGLSGEALLVAHQTSSGERVLHFYGDSAHSAVPRIRRLLAGYPGGATSVQAEFDPMWENVDHLRP